MDQVLGPRLFISTANASAEEVAISPYGVRGCDLRKVKHSREVTPFNQEIAAFVEEPEPGAPYGAKGIGEPPTISSSAAVAAAVRAATGLPLPRIPIRPADIDLP